MRVFVILPAAGLGTRMLAAGNSPTQAEPGRTLPPKQFLELAGLPILVHTLQAFLAVGAVSRIALAVRAHDQPRAAELLSYHGLSERVQIVEGGDTRQESVGRALQAFTAPQTVDAAAPSSSPHPNLNHSLADDDIVLVHDAVRPLIAPAVIERTIEAVVKHGAAIVGLPATDTIKQVERTASGALITATIPREFIVQAQTPQGFRAHLLRQAFAEAEADEFRGTDEASLVERAGFPVAVVPGSLSNMKITQPGDLELAEFFLSRAGRQ